MGKIRVGVIFGGRSAEHEVALQSAKNVIDAIDRKKYDVVLIGIDKTGRWQLAKSGEYLLNASDPKLIKLNASGGDLAVVPGFEEPNKIVSTSSGPNPEAIDVAFPVLHGPYGEDGTIQGLLKMADIPFVGADVLGSAAAMDKDVMKRLLRDANVPIPKFLSYTQLQKDSIDFSEVKETLGLPVFVKPANNGSSVGVSRAADDAELRKAIELAFRFDKKILIEEAIDGREIELAVLGNEEPIVSIAGEIVSENNFYSYEAKYIEENTAKLIVPAPLPEDVLDQCQKIAVQAFQVLEIEGMARADLFLTKDNKILVNELNTIPGFTKISMYPRLWEASGIPYPKLIDRLLTLALERHERAKSLQVSYE